MEETTNSVQKVSQKITQSKTVKAKSYSAQGVRELFVDELNDVYWAKKTLTKALPKMFKNATTQQLIAALKDNLEETKKHLTRITNHFKKF